MIAVPPSKPPSCDKCDAPMRRIACLAPLRTSDEAKLGFLCVPCDEVQFVEDHGAVPI
jgi:hypothetical protein